MFWQRRETVSFSVSLVILELVSSTCALAQNQEDLNSILNQVDAPKYWRNSPPPDGEAPGYSPPPYPSYPYNKIFSPSRPSRASSYAMSAIPALNNSSLWRNISRSAMAGAGANASTNPFNLSPFGMLHYMWDDTQYVSNANPVTLYQVQNELQQATQYSQMAGSAASRAKYAGSPEERSQAAQQALYYASLAKQAAAKAKQISQSGSLNPSQVADAVADQAEAASSYAHQANRYANNGF